MPALPATDDVPPERLTALEVAAWITLRARRGRWDGQPRKDAYAISKWCGWRVRRRGPQPPPPWPPAEQAAPLDDATLQPLLGLLATAWEGRRGAHAAERGSDCEHCAHKSYARIARRLARALG